MSPSLSNGKFSQLILFKNDVVIRVTYIEHLVKRYITLQKIPNRF